jgi:hypothetical protein
VHSPGLLLLQPARAGVHHALQQGWVSARYGDKQPAPAVQGRVVAHDADFDTVLLPWQGSEPTMRVQDVPVLADEGTGASGLCALRIEWHVDGQPVVDHWFHARGAQAAPRRVGAHVFNARWLWWREDADGRLLHAVSHPGARLPAVQRGVALA